MSRNLIGAIIVVAILVGLLPGAASAQQATGCTDVVVQPGDTLSLIAGRTLGAGQPYTAIVDATNAAAAVDSSYTAIANPNVISVGWKLCVPGSTAALSTPSPASTPESVADDGPSVEEMRELAIDRLRARDYPASPLVIEQTLAPGANYSRYLASYLADGLKIYGLLTVPTGEKPATGWPVIVFNHGYIPPAQYRTTERYVAYVDGFARNGYIVFKSDYRGHGSSEGEATGGYSTPAYTVDVLHALSALREYPDADPERIGMWGHSMGGHITLRSMVVDEGIKAGVIWAGVVASYPDLLARWDARRAAVPQRARRWRQVLAEEFGTPEENPEFWASISANSYLADLSGPLQLHHGTADDSVPVEFSALLAEQMAAAGQPVENYTYAGDDHNLSGNFSTAMERSIRFFDQHVKGVSP